MEKQINGKEKPIEKKNQLEQKDYWKEKKEIQLKKNEPIGKKTT